MVFALEAKWPIIPGAPEITDVSTVAQFTVYIYALFVSLGSFIAVAVLISAGIDFLTSHNIAKIKVKIAGAIIGLFVLLIPYSLLVILNPDILNPSEKILSCEKSKVCIVREIKTKITSITTDENGKTTTTEKEEEKTIEESGVQSTPKINEDSTSELNNGKTIRKVEKKQTITIKKYDGLQMVVAFSKENYEGDVSVLFADDSNNDDINKSITADIFISGETYKSFEIVPKTAGVYFFDEINYGVVKSAPFRTDVGVADLMEKSIKSIDIVNPEKDNSIDYVGLLFDKKNYRIKCSPFYTDKDSLPSSTEGSVKIYKRDKKALEGSKIVLTLYNNTSCGSRTASEAVKTTSKGWNEIKKCEIILINNNEEIPVVAPPEEEEEKIDPDCDQNKYNCKVTLKSVNTIFSPQVIVEACPNFAATKQYPREEVLSFRIDSTATIVFLDDYKACNVWDLLRIAQGEGDCKQVNSGGLNPSSSFRPKKFYVIPH